jgi:hypothetical protein
MEANPPKTFVELVKYLETTLKAGEYLFTRQENSIFEPVSLKSLKLTEVRCHKKGQSYKVTLILDGRFKGRHGPHKFAASDKLMAALGITGLSIGMGATTFDKGTVAKGISVEVHPSLLAASLADALDAVTGEKATQAETGALKRVEQTKAYQEGLLRIGELEKEIGRLTKLSTTVKGKLERLSVKAIEKAKTMHSSTGATKPKFNVVVI